MITKPARTQEPVNELLASRWSGRAYDPARDVEHRRLVSLMEAARWAPSCFGDEPWRYIVCRKSIDPDAWNRALACLSEGNQQWAQRAPVLIAVLADSVFSSRDRDNRWGQYDTGAASMSICIQATELGLMAHQMGGFDPQQLTAAFNIPERYVAMSVMAIGYQMPRENIPEDMLERELAGRRRRPLRDSFFAGSWGRAFTERD